MSSQALSRKNRPVFSQGQGQKQGFLISTPILDRYTGQGQKISLFYSGTQDRVQKTGNRSCLRFLDRSGCRAQAALELEIRLVDEEARLFGQRFLRFWGPKLEGASQ